MLVPSARPLQNIDLIQNIISANNINLAVFPVVLVAIRGRFLDSMGAQGKNDRGLYDDAAYWVTPEAFASFNFNTDPSRFRAGQGSGSAKGMAMLKPGVWYYKTGWHWGSTPHQAFRQAAPVSIWRDSKNGRYDDRLNESINIHRGGVNGTSSLGCQTVPPSQWAQFKAFGYTALERYKRTNRFPYVLIDEEKLRQGVLTV